jgi:hypothetical protein
VRIDNVSKARYGTLLKQLGGWAWMQDLLQVRAHGIAIVDMLHIFVVIALQ